MFFAEATGDKLNGKVLIYHGPLWNGPEADKFTGFKFIDVKKKYSKKDIKNVKRLGNENNKIAVFDIELTDGNTFILKHNENNKAFKCMILYIYKNNLLRSESSSARSTPMNLECLYKEILIDRKIDRKAVRELVKKFQLEREEFDGNVHQLSLDQQDSVEEFKNSMTEAEALTFSKIYLEETNALLDETRALTQETYDVIKNIEDSSAASQLSTTIILATILVFLYLAGING